MKFHLVSDLHLDAWMSRNDFFIYDLLPEGDETLIIAGDLCEIAHLRDYGAEIFGELCGKYQNVIYVAGNHEYYGTDYQGFQDRFRRLEGMFDNLFCLEDESIVIGDVSIAGSTLWFRNTPMNPVFENQLADFTYIQDYRNWVYDRNEAAVEFLQNLPEVDLIITHHLPCSKSVDAKYANEATNLYFLCDISGVILDKQPKVWCHGHTHIACEYQLGETQVICNPRGYPGENAKGYEARVIEI